MRHLRHQIIFVIILGSLFLISCSVSPSAPLETPSLVATTRPPTEQPLPSATLPPRPTETSVPIPMPTFTPTTTPIPTLSSLPALTPNYFVYGQSAGGRDLVAWQFGQGSTTLALVGGIRGQSEWNTTELARSLADDLLAKPALLPDDSKLLIIPLANPDITAMSAGVASIPSEAQATALRDLFLAENVQAVLFLNSFNTLLPHGGILPGPGAVSASLGAAMAGATGYPLAPSSADRLAANQAAAWLEAQGITYVDVHLPDPFQLHRQANLAGLLALLRWPSCPPLTPEPVPLVTPAPQWGVPSPLYGDLVTGYPLEIESGRFTLHYQPGTPAAGDADYLIGAVERALAHINVMLDVDPDWHFDLYLAGTPFAYPGETSRGYTLPYTRQVFHRYDCTGPLVEFESGLVHELTHLTALNEFLPASSGMFSEGLAVYTQWPLLEAAAWLELDQICAAMHRQNALPPAIYLASDEADFAGYIDQANYMASGCFVRFLAKRWGVESVAKLYHSADWQGITGYSLAELDRLWLADRTARAEKIVVNSTELVNLLNEMGHAYAYLTAHREQVQGLPAGRALDGLRVTWRMGRFDRARAYAGEFRALTSGQ